MRYSTSTQSCAIRAADASPSDFDPGDHLHPNDAGFKAMAESIDLALLRPDPAIAIVRISPGTLRE